MLNLGSNQDKNLYNIDRFYENKGCKLLPYFPKMKNLEHQSIREIPLYGRWKPIRISL